MIRVVIDTNVIISGVLFSGPPRELVDLRAAGRIVVVTASSLIAELEDVLFRSKFSKAFERTGDTPAQALDTYVRLSESASMIADVPANAVRDPKDVKFLAVAVGGNAEYLITGDEDLLSLGVYQNVKIITPAYFLNVVMSGQR